MTISSYCYKQGMTLEQYRQFENNIVKTAKAILHIIETKYADRVDNGMYYPTSDILTYKANSDIYIFIICELKKLGVQFIENGMYYRY